MGSDEPKRQDPPTSESETLQDRDHERRPPPPQPGTTSVDVYLMRIVREGNSAGRDRDRLLEEHEPEP